MHPDLCHASSGLSENRLRPTSDIAELLDCHVGEHFVAIFGSNQSALETVLLKRRVMMPCWLSLKRPTRIDTSAQVHLALKFACPDCSN